MSDNFIILPQIDCDITLRSATSSLFRTELTVITFQNNNALCHKLLARLAATQCQQEMKGLLARWTDINNHIPGTVAFPAAIRSSIAEAA